MGKATHPRLAVAAMLGLALGLAGACSSGSGGQGAGAKVHLTYAMWETPESVGYQKSIDEFQKRHPDISVSIQTIAYNNYQPKLTTQFSSGGGPDIFWSTPR